MQRIVSILLFVAAFFAFFIEPYAQSTSTQGKDFWLSFGMNGGYKADSLDLQVRIVAGANTAEVKFIYTESVTTNTVTIPAGNVVTFSLSDMQKSRVFSNITGKSDKSLHIESNEPISVYALNQGAYTTDATNVLPVTALGIEYYHISYKSSKDSEFEFDDDGYTLIATENNTDIYVNNKWTVNLNKGQVYSAYFPDSDSTGIHITSTHPVAYFVTNKCVYVPVDKYACDCLYQQLVPVNKWGNNFLVPVTHRGRERIRIVASQDGTLISQTGGVIKTDNAGYGQNSLTLNKGQFVELETALSTCGCYITANKPIGVCSYLIGMEYSSLTVHTGDPAMAWVPPIEQSVTGALISPFIPSGNSALEEHYVLIVTPTLTKNQTTIATGTEPATGLTGGNWCDNSTSGYSFYSLRLTNETESYFFSNPYGLTIMGYGIGDYESYYYLSGAASRNLDAAFYVNNIHYQDLDNSTLCDTVANLRALLQYAQTSVAGFLRWYIDGVEQTSKKDVFEWQKNLSKGNHTIAIDVVSMDNDTIRLSATFTVGMAYYNTINTAICQYDEIYKLHGFDIDPTESGFSIYENISITPEGCDSITVLNLTVNPVFAKDTFATIYEDEFYQIGNYKYNISGTHTAHLQTHEGCDSIINLNLTVLYYPHEITAFSPFNKDGINDYFMPEYKIQVFNRYGVLIYETQTEEQQALGWDGRNSKGQEVEPGLYFYILYSSNGKPLIKSSVEVLKKMK
jgi:hypothetical protein